VEQLQMLLALDAPRHRQYDAWAPEIQKGEMKKVQPKLDELDKELARQDLTTEKRKELVSKRIAVQKKYDRHKHDYELGLYVFDSARQKKLGSYLKRVNERWQSLVDDHLELIFD